MTFTEEGNYFLSIYLEEGTYFEIRTESGSIIYDTTYFAYYEGIELFAPSAKALYSKTYDIEVTSEGVVNIYCVDM